MVLVLAGILATAQNITAQERINRQVANYEHSEFEKSEVPILKKQKSGDDWWEPDTVFLYNTNVYSEQVSYRYIYSYNSQGAMILRLYQEWQNNTWVNNEKDTYIYDNNGNMLSESSQRWENITWTNYFQSIYNYDANNYLQSRLFQIGSGVDTWVNSSLLTYSYDSNNNKSSELYQKWWYNSWENESRFVYYYDDNNNITTALYQQWISGAWINNQQKVYNYDSNNNLLKDLFQTWHNEILVNAWQYVYTYDTNNNRQTELHQDWKNEAWENNYQILYSYDANGNMMTYLDQAWLNNSWKNRAKVTCTYDENNNILSRLLSTDWYWTGTWSDNQKYLWNYDENNNCTQVEAWNSNYGNWELSNFSVSLYFNNMQSCYNYEYYYKAVASYIKVSNSTAAVDIVLPNISVYPNPTSGQLNITHREQNIQQISIFDIFGTKQLGTKQTTIDISHLSVGVYFVQIITGKGIVTKKIIKR